MYLKIIDGCVELDKIYSVGDIIDCQDEKRAKVLIDEGYCIKIDKYDMMRYKDTSEKNNNIINKNYKNEKKDKKTITEEQNEESLDDLREKLNLQDI